jgi:hypothetical protein
MSGLSFAYQKTSGSPIPVVSTALIGKSTQIHVGDILIRTEASALTTSATPVVRPLFSGDTITSSNGILGVALFDIQTNSSGVLTTVSSPVSVSTRGQLDTSLPLTNVLPTDPVTGFVQIYFATFDLENVFRGYSATNDVVSFYQVGRKAGISASAASAPSNYTIDLNASASNCPFIIDGVDTEDAQYNSANGGADVYVRCLAAFNQTATATLWAT